MNLGIYDYVGEFENGVALVMKKGKFGLNNINGQEIAKCEYDVIGAISDHFRRVEKMEK